MYFLMDVNTNVLLENSVICIPLLKREAFVLRTQGIKNQRLRFGKILTLLFRIPINYLLVNLAVADSFFATFHTTEVVYSHIDTHPDGVAGKVACVFRNSVLQWIGTSASTFTVVAIAVERYFAVMYPYQNKKKLTMEKVKVCHHKFPFLYRCRSPESSCTRHVRTV